MEAKIALPLRVTLTCGHGQRDRNTMLDFQTPQPSALFRNLDSRTESHRDIERIKPNVITNVSASDARYLG